MTGPPVAWGQVRGQVVFDSGWSPVMELGSSGFSMVGSRSLLLTDHPAVYVHDTGGFGSAFVTALEPAADPGATFELTEASTRLVADVQLPGGRSLRVATAPVLSPEVLGRLTNLRGRLLPDAAAASFVSPCAVSVTPRYEETEPDGADPPAVVTPGPAGPGATETTAYVVVKAGRLELRSRGKVVVDWPANRVTAAPTGPASVEVRGGAVLEGRFLTGAVLHLITPQVREAFLAVVAAAGSGSGPAGTEPAAVGTSAAVSVRGLGDGTGVLRVDCVLGESVLELQGQDSAAVLASFDLTDPQLRVAGSAERFVVFHPGPGPVTVQSDSEVFGRRLHAHPALQAAAERTLAHGPFPAELTDGKPVACAVTPDALRVKGPGVDLTMPFPAIRTVEGEAAAPRARLRVATDRVEIGIVGQLELVQAVHTEVVAGNHATAPPQQLPDQLRAAVGLEEDYFLYTIFGPFYELHAALLGDVGGDGLGAAVKPPDSDEQRAGTAVVLTEGLAELQRHLDQIGVVLPAFVRHRDAELLEPVTGREPAWLKAQEGQLRLALAPVQRVAAETAGLAAQVSRLIDLDPASLPRPSYTGAAVTLGAAALLNPVFAIAGATQAYRQYSQGQERKAQLTAQSTRAWTVALDRWNTLVGTSIPLLGYLVTENVFGLRWEAARQISQELRDIPAQHREAAKRGVARRLARLDVLRRYPAGAGLRLRRGEIADHLKTARDAVPTPRLVNF
jgi:hypothetical protein